MEFEKKFPEYTFTDSVMEPINNLLEGKAPSFFQIFELSDGGRLIIRGDRFATEEDAQKLIDEWDPK